MGYDLDLIDDPESERKIIEGAKVLNRVRHAMLTSAPEKSGAMFICGASREVDRSGLPVRLHVCPTYGLDGFAVYEQVIPYTAPGY